ncbi:MAG: HTH domain-containing protein [Bacteroidales bacterium]|nr:HTH domain-containing protein [Bacteroidales bacterium]
MPKPFSIETLQNKPEGQTFDRKSARIDAKATTHFSRNPKIAYVLRDYGFVKEFGEGVNRIYEEMEKAGLPAPEFKQTDFIMRATIRKVEINHELRQKNVPENVPEKSKRNILDDIRKNPHLTLTDLAEKYSVDIKTIKRDIGALKQKGCIVRIGSDKGGYWKINDLVFAMEHLPENVPENVPEKSHRNILDDLRENPRLTITDLAKKYSVDIKTIKRDIDTLRQKGLITRIGPDKGGYWQVNENVDTKAENL